MSVISRVMYLLNQKNIKPIELQNKTGISPSSFTSWKNGDRNPKRESVEKMAEFLGVTTEYLYGNEEHIKIKEDEEIYKLNVKVSPEEKEILDKLLMHHLTLMRGQDK